MFAFWFPGALVRNNLLIVTNPGSGNDGTAAPGNFLTRRTLAAVGFIAGTQPPARAPSATAAGTEGLSLGAEIVVSVAPPVTYPAFPTTGLLDPTTQRRTNPSSPTAGCWSPRRQLMQLLSNAIATVTNAAGYAVTAATTSGADCEVWATVSANTAAGGCELYARYPPAAAAPTAWR